MLPSFFILAVVAVASTALVITRKNAIHALLYLIVSLLSIAMVFFLMGAHFAAALEVIIYAGAIMVLFIFVVMILNLGQGSVEQEKRWLGPRAWIGPGILLAILAAEMVFLLAGGPGGEARVGAEVDSRRVGTALYGAYLLGVEAASFLLLAGLIGAFHLGRRRRV